MGYNYRMEILGLEKMSIVDYDGKVASTIFTGSCNFRCPFCHNSALVLDYQKISPIPESELMAFLEKRKNLLDGVCITGGEPTLQKDLPDLCEKIKKLGYAVKLDTNGTNPNMVKQLNENGLVDYFAMDIKNSLDDYAPIIGLERYNTSKVEETVNYFLSEKANYEFRTTLIKEFHTKENIIKIGEWIAGANKYFLQKFKSGDNTISQGLTAVDNDIALNFKNILTKTVPKTFLRGYDNK